ncbi:MAG: hypothetical protein IJO33_01700 [Bacilli bacterium]|nr:hypothetical protein [Bacilli bacterium]
MSIQLLVLILSIVLQLIFYKKNNFKFGNIDLLLYQVAFIVYYQIGQFNYLYSDGLNSVADIQETIYITILFNIIFTYVLKAIKTRSYVSANKIGLYFWVMIIDFVCLGFFSRGFDLIVVHIIFSFVFFICMLLINFILWLLKKIKKISIDYDFDGSLFSKKINVIIILFLLVIPMLIVCTGKYNFKKQETIHKEKAIKVADAYVGSNYELTYFDKEYRCFMFCHYDDWIGYEMTYESKIDKSKIYLSIDKETFEIIEHNYNK